MSLKIRLSAAIIAVGALSAVGLLVLQSHATARSQRLNYMHLNKIQKRIISETLASALGPQPQGLKPRVVPVPGGDDGGGGDGAPANPPASFGSPGGTGSSLNYFPTQQGQCSQNLGQDVKVNQNCLNLTDSKLQGRGQANNEPSISVDPFNSRHLVASENNYIRGDGTCGSHFSLDGGNSWADTTIPNSFTYGPSGFARQYWQAGGDTSVAWDTRGNAYESCQLFNRGNPTSPNPDQSSGFVVFRATQNNGASWNFPGRYSAVFFAPNAGPTPVLEDKQLIAIDDNKTSPFRDRIYITYTEFAADGTAYIYETHSNDYGETFSPRVLVSADSALCPNTFGVPTPNGRCNENQFSDPFVGPDGSLYVTWVNFNNSLANASDNHNQVMLAKSTDGGATFSAPVLVSNYYDLPDCLTYQGDDPGRACVPEKGSSTKSVFRATNYSSGAVNPHHPNVVTVEFGSYINKDSNESNGCVPAGVSSATGINLYTGVKTPGACNNKILVSVSTDGGATFTGTTTDPRNETLVTQSRGQNGTDQFWQWSAFTRDGKLAVDYYDRQYGNDETTGSSDFSLSGSRDLTRFGQIRLTSSSMPAPTQFYSVKGGLFYGDYVWLSASDDKAYSIWSDTRATDLFLCPGTGTPGNPPALCTATEPNGQQANDEETYMTASDVPTGHGDGWQRDHGRSRTH